MSLAIVLAVTGVIGALTIGVGVVTIVETRKRYYHEYLERKGRK